MVRSPGFGSNPMYLFALFRLAFTMAPSNDLTLHIKLTRWIVLQKARRHRINLLRLLVGTQFQDLFHSPPGVLFTFPSRYLFTIDHKIYLVLEGGPPRFSQGCTCPDLLESTNISPCFTFVYEAITLFGATFQLLPLAKQVHLLIRCQAIIA